MNKLNQRIFIVLLMIFGSISVYAEELLSPAMYANELNRCIAQVRVQTDTEDQQSLRHRITGVEKEGAWYNFTIETLAIDNDIAAPHSSSECRAHRYSETTRLTVSATATGDEGKKAQLVQNN